MRVVHVFSAPQSPYFFLSGQIDYLTERGVDVHVVLPKDDFFSEMFKKREVNATVHHVQMERKISLFSDIKSLINLIRLFSKLKPDIIHLHTPKASFLGAIAGRICFNKNIIFQMHGLISSYGNQSQKGIVYYTEKMTCFFAHKVFAVSNSLREFAVQQKYCNERKISVVNNGTINGINSKNIFNKQRINFSRYLPIDTIKDKFIVGFIGRISEDKGIDDYLYVLSKIKDRGSFLGVVVGPDESKYNLSNKLLEYGLKTEENVDLILMDSVLDPQNIIADFDILLFPTKREGFGLVAAEANALEIPVVGYDIPGVKDAVSNNETGLLVKYNDIEALEEAVMFYYRNEEIRLRHGLNGRKRVRELFNPLDIWKEIYKVYKNCLNS